MTQNRNPGNARLIDRWTNKDGSPSARNGKGKRWAVQWVNFQGEQKSASFDRQTDAKQFVQDVTADLRTGNYVNPEDLKNTVGSFHKAWESSLSKLKPTTAESRKSIWKNYVDPKWGRIQIGSIKPSHINEWVTELHDSGKKPDLIYICVVVLRAVLKQAVDAGKLRGNPATNITIPKKDETPRPYLTVAQVKALADATTDYTTLIRFLAFTGLRWGEVAALRTSSIDLERRRIEVSAAITTPKGKRVEGSPKNRKTRSVPFPAALDTELKELIESRMPGDYLFQSYDGKPLDNSNFRARHFKPAVEACVDKDPAFPAGLTIHDLRHTAASLAVSSGANVLALQRMLGHKKPSVTLDIYSELFDDDLDAVAVGMNRLIVGKVETVVNQQ